MAQVTARKRGKAWEYRFETASVDGKRKQKSKGGFRTKAEAIKAGTAALTEYNQTGHTVKTDNQISVQDFFTKWHELTANTRSYGTNQVNLLMMRKHIFPALGAYKLAAVTHSALQQFLNEKGKKYAPGTVNKMKSVIVQGFNYAYYEMEIIKSNPAQRLKVTGNEDKKDKRVRAYTTDEILEMADMMKGRKAWYAIMIAAYTGMRIGEICALTWDDVDADRRVITVRGIQVEEAKNGSDGLVAVIHKGKTDAGMREIRYGDGLAKILHKLKIEQSENSLYYGEYYQRNYLDEHNRVHVSPEIKEGEKRFLMRQENGTFYQKFLILKHIRQASGGKFKFHNIRHTQATTLIESGVPLKEVQYRIGHADIRTTMNQYAEATEKMHNASVHAIENAWTNRGQIKEV